MQFVKAQRTLSKLRLAIAGPSGSGKTWSALEIATGLGGRIAVIDSERGSASLYANRFDFEVLDLAPPFTPERYVEAIRLAEGERFDVCIIDSITHEWNGVGGCMEIVDSLAAGKFRGNTWAAFSVVTPRHRAFIDAMSQSPLHLIATMRTKMDTAQEERNGKKVVVKLGTKVEQRDGVEYEFTTVFDVDHEHNAIASKDRTGLFADPHRITVETGRKIKRWLESAKPATPKAPDPVEPAPGNAQPAQKVAPEEDPFVVELVEAGRSHGIPAPATRLWLRAQLQDKKLDLAKLPEAVRRGIVASFAKPERHGELTDFTIALMAKARNLDAAAMQLNATEAFDAMGVTALTASAEQRAQVIADVEAGKLDPVPAGASA